MYAYIARLPRWRTSRSRLDVERSSEGGTYTHTHRTRRGGTLDRGTGFYKEERQKLKMPHLVETGKYVANFNTQIIWVLCRLRQSAWFCSVCHTLCAVLSTRAMFDRNAGKGRVEYVGVTRRQLLYHLLKRGALENIRSAIMPLCGTMSAADFFITAINASVQHVALSISAVYVVSFFIFAVIWWLVVQYVVKSAQTLRCVFDTPCTTGSPASAIHRSTGALVTTSAFQRSTVLATLSFSRPSHKPPLGTATSPSCHAGRVPGCWCCRPLWG